MVPRRTAGALRRQINAMEKARIVCKPQKGLIPIHTPMAIAIANSRGEVYSRINLSNEFQSVCPRDRNDSSPQYTI
jgi:hypothetical protein